MSDGWVDVARTSDIPPGCAARVEIDETAVDQHLRECAAERMSKHAEPPQIQTAGPSGNAPRFCCSSHS